MSQITNESFAILEEATHQVSHTRNARDEDLRLQCLHLAANMQGILPSLVLGQAKEFYDFITSGEPRSTAEAR